MPLFETISAFRNQIMKSIMETIENIPEGFNQDIVPPWDVRHPALDKNQNLQQNPAFDDQTWEIRLFQKENVALLLQFMVQGNGEDNPQAITIHNHTFSCIKLFINDSSELPNPHNVTRLDIREILNDQLPRKEGDSYVPADGYNIGRPWRSTIGHICDVYIRNTDQVWNIPNGKNQMTDDMLKKIVSAAIDLLPVAAYYCDNKKNLFNIFR